jgi:DNA-binding beta-propeller fold protein YncE
MLIDARRAVARFAVILLSAQIGVAWAQSELFVLNESVNVSIYPRTANGNVAPSRTIFGPATGLNSPVGLAVDSLNNEITVANGGASITVYALSAGGNVPPLRTIAGPSSTGLAGAFAVVVDTVNNELTVLTPNGGGVVTVYARTANGNVAPLRSISGAATGMDTPRGLALDIVNDELFVANFDNSITVYARTANGNAVPKRTLVGAATGLNAPRGLVVDSVNNELIVANAVGPSVTVYSRGASQNTAPLRTISGAATGLNGTYGVTVDNTNDEIAVANPGSNTVTVYPRTASGNFSPLRTLAGAATGLSSPVRLAVTTGTPPPPVFQSAVSRKTHGGAGPFNLSLSLVATNPTTEPRQGPAQTIVFTFNKPISGAAAAIVEGTTTVGLLTVVGNDVIVDLNGVTDQQYVTIALSNVTSADGGTGGSASVRLGYLVGDVNQNRVVTLADLGLVNAQLAQPVTAANFLKDVNASGTLTVADKGITNANLTRALPAP